MAGLDRVDFFGINRFDFYGLIDFNGSRFNRRLSDFCFFAADFSGNGLSGGGIGIISQCGGAGAQIGRVAIACGQIRRR